MKFIKVRKDFTLLDGMLFLCIAAVLVICVFAFYQKYKLTERVTIETRNITTIQTGVKLLYAATSNYVGLNNTVAVNASIFPANMLVNNVPVNIFNGKVLLEPSIDSPSGSPNSSFAITYFGVPAIECMRIVSDVGSNFYSVGVGISKAGIMTKNIKKSGGDMDMHTLALACQTGDDNNIITFTSL